MVEAGSSDFKYEVLSRSSSRGDNTLTHYLYNGRAGVSTDDNGLYYMRKRYYNTDIKRFINSDILTGSIDNSQSLNRYSYVQGNPVSYTDPFGLSPMSGFFSGTGLAHGIFGILGCVPGPIGIAANVADALVYGIVDHDAVGVTLSLLGALTMGAGSVAKLAGAGAKVTKTAKAIQYGSMFITSGLQFALNAKNTINVGKTMYDKYIVNGQKTDKNTYAEVAALVLNSAGMFISGTQIYSSGRGFVNELSTSVNSNVLTEVNAGGRETTAAQSEANRCGSESVKYSPINPCNEISKEVAESFNGATFTKMKLTEDTLMYRVSGGKAGKVGSYLSRIPQGGGLQSQLDLALNPAWENTAENITKVIVPKETVVYEGIVAPQNIYDSMGNVIGVLPGGGNQVYISKVKEWWFK